MGSSPLARGLHPAGSEEDAGGRIIPARAGFTETGCFGSVGEGDHPRSRGVYLGRRGLIVLRFGSSPLARGLRLRGRSTMTRLGIIPARAGFTDKLPEPTEPAGDHPRSRGVYLIRGLIARLGKGSSPLARGLLRDHARHRVRAGIIPARAGFTDGSGVARTPRADHPRSRGVYTWRSLESQRSLTLPDGFRLHC